MQTPVAADPTAGRERLAFPDRRYLLDDERFRVPRRGDRPGMRWWWQSPLPKAELVRELRAIAEAGFGEVEIAFSPDFWANEAQRDALSAVLDEAARLDVGVATTLGAAWPLQTPNTARGSGHAAQEMQYGVTYLTGDADRSIPVPVPFDDVMAERAMRLVAVTAARVVTRSAPPTVTSVVDYLGERQGIINPERSTVLELASVQDLSAEVIDGYISWPGREGEWALFGFWMRDCEQGATSFIDREAALAAADYLDEYQIGVQNTDRIRQVGTDLFEDSLELNADSLFWTRDLLARFAQRRGYDLTPLLPVLFAHGMCRYWVPNEEPTPDFAFDDDSGRRVRRDYYRLLTDLYIDDHLLVLHEWAATHGLRHKAQVAYGQNLEPVRSNREFVRRGGHAEGESLNSGDRAPVERANPNWRYALDWQRAVVGGAHQGGAARISTELGAQFAAAFTLTLGDYKQMLDKEWAAGLTKPFVHGFASQETDAPWPTQTRFWDHISESWNDLHYPEWANWRPLTDYWARGTVLLETGTPRTDVAIYRDGFLTTAARGSALADATAPAQLIDSDSLERAGYSVQFLDPIGLAEAEVGPDGCLFPTGPHYRAVIIDERELTAEAAEAIDAAAERGLRVVVVGQLPDRDSGFVNAEERDARVRKAIGRLIDRPSAVQVAVMADSAAALQQLGLRPRVAFDEQPLLTQWREAGSRRYVLAYNTDSRPAAVALSFEGRGAARELNLWTGGNEPTQYEDDGDRTVLTVELAPLDLRIFELDISMGEPPRVEPRDDPPNGEWQEVPCASWSIEVSSEEPGGTRRFRLDDQGPGDWRDIEEMKDVSGVAFYRTRVSADGIREFTIELGSLAGSATVRAGGREFGPVYTSGAVVALGDALARGDQIEIEVRTPLHNAVVASATRPGVRTPPQPQGLIGPVRVRGSRSCDALHQLPMMSGRR